METLKQSSESVDYSGAALDVAEDAFFQGKNLDSLYQELQEGFQTIRNEHPEVFEPDEGEVKSYMGEVADRVTDEDLKEFMEMTFDAYRRDEAEEFLVSRIAAAYGLKRTPELVQLNAVERNDFGEPSSELGYYDSKTNKIVIFLGKGGADSWMQIVDAISHELWHAKQEEYRQQKDSDRAELYELNKRYYVDGNRDYAGYRRQLVEIEAFAVGTTIGRRYIEAVYEQLNDEDIAELDSFAKRVTDSGMDLATAFKNGDLSMDDYLLIVMRQIKR